MTLLFLVWRHGSFTKIRILKHKGSRKAPWEWQIWWCRHFFGPPAFILQPWIHTRGEAQYKLSHDMTWCGWQICPQQRFPHWNGHNLILVWSRYSPKIVLTQPPAVLLRLYTDKTNRPFSADVTSYLLINQQCWIARIFSQNILYEVLRWYLKIDYNSLLCSRVTHHWVPSISQWECTRGGATFAT